MASASMGSNPFEPLELSDAGVEHLKGLVHDLVSEHMHSYEYYVHHDQRRLDRARWKVITQRENLRVFAEQPHRARRRSSASKHEESSTSEQPDGDALATNIDMPALLLTGTVEGLLEDVMYGVLNPTVVSMRVKSSYVGDKFAACAVLATLAQPSASDPFRSHTVKWFEGDHPKALRALVKNRDFVYMEATGLTQLSTGETVGYHVMHSIDFPETAATNSNVRGKMAVCALFCQRNEGIVDVFTKTIADPGGRVPRAIAVHIGAIALASAQNLVHCARMKKLTWLLTHHSKSTMTRRTADEQLPGSSHVYGARWCVVCNERMATKRFGDTTRHMCALCSQPACSACLVRQDLSFVALDGGLRRQHVRFCALCSNEAVRSSARSIAVEEIVASQLEELQTPRRTMYAHGQASVTPSSSP